MMEDRRPDDEGHRPVNPLLKRIATFPTLFMHRSMARFPHDWILRQGGDTDCHRLSDGAGGLNLKYRTGSVSPRVHTMNVEKISNQWQPRPTGSTTRSYRSESVFPRICGAFSPAFRQIESVNQSLGAPMSPAPAHGINLGLEMFPDCRVGPKPGPDKGRGYWARGKGSDTRCCNSGGLTLTGIRTQAWPLSPRPRTPSPLYSVETPSHYSLLPLSGLHQDGRQ